MKSRHLLIPLVLATAAIIGTAQGAELDSAAKPYIWATAVKEHVEEIA